MEVTEWQAVRREARAIRLDLRPVALAMALVAFLVGISVYNSGPPDTMAVLVAARDLPEGAVAGTRICGWGRCPSPTR